MYTQLGMDTKPEIHAPDGPPFALVNNGKMISELI